MKTLHQIIERIEDNEIQVSNYKEDGKLCGYELNTYTNLGVNQIVFLDFRDAELNPKKPSDFIKVLDNYIDEIDIDEEIDMHRQDDRFKQTFSIRESLEDFEKWKNDLSNLIKNLKN